jgi:large subunit ribosomal protein L32e
MARADVVKEFTKIKGVGKAKAEALFDNGFDSIDKLKKTKSEDLIKIDGITDAIAKNITSEFKGKKAEIKPKKVPVKKETVEKKPKPKAKKEEAEKTEKKSEEKAKPKKITKKKEEKEEEIVEEEKKEEYRVKKKPTLSKEHKELLKTRKEIKNRTPDFLREEWFRYKRIPKNWRRPDGISSKMRINLKYRPSKVRVGFRGPREIRGLHSSGFEEVMVYNVDDLENLDPKTQAARIGSSVGTKKRMDIEKKAEELDVRILNM